MKLSKYFNLALGLVLFIGAQTLQAQTLTLKKGNTYEVATTAKTITEMEMMGQSMTMDMSQSATYHIGVTSAAAEQYTLTNKITEMQMSVKQMGREISFDSNNPADFDTPQGSVLKAIINTEIPVTINKKGEVVNIDMDNIKNDNIAKFGKEFKTTGYGATFLCIALPESLTPGKSWQTSVDSEGTHVSTTYKVESVDGKLVHLNFSGDMDINNTFKQGAMETTSKLKGAFSGKMTVNSDTNIIVSSNRLTNLKGESTVMGQTIPTSSTMTVTTKAKEI